MDLGTPVLVGCGMPGGPCRNFWVIAIWVTMNFRGAKKNSQFFSANKIFLNRTQWKWIGVGIFFNENATSSSNIAMDMLWNSGGCQWKLFHLQEIEKNMFTVVATTKLFYNPWYPGWFMFRDPYFITYKIATLQLGRMSFPFFTKPNKINKSSTTSCKCNIP